MIERPLLIGGEPVITPQRVDVRSPYDDAVVGRTYEAAGEDVEAAVCSVDRGFETMRTLPSYRRAEILQGIAGRIQEQREDLARTMALESGKPIRDARLEVDRAVLTMTTAAGESVRLYGDTIPLDVLPSARGRVGITRRFPLGPVLAITPFNFPLNLVCHKLGPAIAAGDSMLIKPAPKTPLSALALAQIAYDSGLPPEGLSVILSSNADAQKLVADERFKALSFTGSDIVGWRLKSLAGKKRVILELGGNAGVIADDSADVELAAQRVAAGGFGYAGQSCISVQRTYVHKAVFGEFADRLASLAGRLKLGNPLDEDTELGPMINPEATERIESWINEAMTQGAEVLAGGHARGSIFEPTVLSGAPPTARVCGDEAFAPVISLFPFSDFSEALDSVNNSRFGLQAGIFTRRLDHAMAAFERLDVGGVVVNDVPTFRVDPMPYGGVKDSGLGREGLRYAIEELTELKLLVLRLD
ncbi:MAG TPA: aldehyde dehydrogenase family protein [Chloroflexota bacterium]|nr:aldehyde dehydrogenase family protein [Chloroflexota bacterium]